MMEVITSISAILYVICIVIITLYCLLQSHLLLLYLFKRRKTAMHASLSSDLPSVTIQLPIFNEKYVIKRLLDAVISMDYPRDKLTIQILDDSTDETTDLVEAYLHDMDKSTIEIRHIRRDNRKGFKAGALQYGLQHTDNEYIAIFDADFIPNPSFLYDIMPFFHDPHVGVIQTRWAHLNQDNNLLTRIQAFQLNVHFTIEQNGRYQGNIFLQFNGTAGVWRSSVIADAGGWKADTLTEDLDLSYRAQLKNWKIIYLEDIATPAELPTDIGGLKSQQYRWMKGGAETAKKLLAEIWKSDASLIKKVHGSQHLLGSSVYLAIFLFCILSVPLSFIIEDGFCAMAIRAGLMVSLILVLCSYFVANVIAVKQYNYIHQRLISFVLLFPVFLALSMGLSLHNSIAVIDGFRGKKTDFIRTPKLAGLSPNKAIQNGLYAIRTLGFITTLEGLLTIYFGAALYFGYFNEVNGFWFHHLLLVCGFGYMFILSIRNNFK